MSDESGSVTNAEVNPPGVFVRSGIFGFVDETLLNFAEHQNVQVGEGSLNPNPSVVHGERIMVCLKKVKK